MADLTGAPYRNSALSPHTRADDLLSRMTLAEKAGVLFHTVMVPEVNLKDSPPGGFGLRSPSDSIIQQHLNHFNILGPVSSTSSLVRWVNAVQTLALNDSRLGIPVTFSTDPRNHFTEHAGTSASAGTLSQWPETLGFAALRDADLVRKFADIARKEYCALGIRCALHPQIDLATEYRWARINATFGEDADLTADLVEAYIQGFQGAKFGTGSVTTITKHFPGGGPQGNDGEDPHFAYGPDAEYPSGMFEYHLKPFERAINAGARQIMPYYSKPVGTVYEEVAFGLNKGIITDLLKNRLGFDGIVCTDWGLITDGVIMGQTMPARAWGAESLTELQRAVKILEAGCDQFGGESRPELIVEAVQNGLISEKRIDLSCRKLLVEKFELGLFDEQRLLDERHAENVVGCADFREAGLDAQRRSCTLLVNKHDTLPLQLEGVSKRFYIEGLDKNLAQSRGLAVVENAAEADIAILCLRAPFEDRDGGFEQLFHAGSLDFPPAEIQHHTNILQTVPTVIFDIYLDRPAVITHLVDKAAAVIINWGIAQPALLDVLLGQVEGSDTKVGPEGKLPFDLPRSMEAVKASPCDKPFSTKDPVFKFGDGLHYTP